MSLAGTLTKTENNVGSSTSKVFNSTNNKPGKLGGMMGSVSSIQKNVAGTVSGVGHIVAKAAGALGIKGADKFFNGTTTTKEIKVKDATPIANLERTYTPNSRYPDETINITGLKQFYHFFNKEHENRSQRIDPTAGFFECYFRFYPNIESMVDLRHRFPERYKKRWSNDREKEREHQGLPTMQFNANKYRTDDTTEITDLRVDKSILPAILTKLDMNGFNIVNDSLVMDYETDLGVFIQRVSFPTIETESEQVQSQVGVFPVPGHIVKPSDNSFTMEVINLEVPVIENVFYPWMREPTLPTWIYSTQPFTTATITFDFTAHNNIKYHFFGCRPTSIMLIQPTQQSETSLTRAVTFTFDFMTVEANNLYRSNPVNDDYQTLDVASDKNKKIKFEGDNRPAEPKKNKSKSQLANSILFSAANSFRL